MNYKSKLNDGQCMSFVLNKNDKSKRRCEKRCKNSDFCFVHLKKKQYYEILLENVNDNINNKNDNIDMFTNIEDKISFLNNNYSHTLMQLCDSWNDVNISDWIIVDDEYWDINILVNVITYQLNNSTMENPYPTFPNNPFNRKLFTVESLFKMGFIFSSIAELIISPSRDKTSPSEVT